MRRIFPVSREYRERIAVSAIGSDDDRGPQSHQALRRPGRGRSGLVHRRRRARSSAFSGPNGAGKTTTMRIITGFLPATSGTVKVEGFDIFDDSLRGPQAHRLPAREPAALRRHDGDVAIWSSSAASKASRAPRCPTRSTAPSSAAASPRSPAACSAISRRAFASASGLAQALIHEPSVLVLDEPTIGLDPRQISRHPQPDQASWPASAR